MALIKQNIKVYLQKKVERIKLDEEQVYFFLTILVGIVSGLAAVGLHYGVQFFIQLAGWGHGLTVKSFLICLVFVLISGYLTTRHFPNTSGSGIPLIRLWLVARNAPIPTKEWLAKIGTTLLSLGSGMSLGREGPTVSISAGVSSTLASYFSMSKKRTKALIAIGAAGGLSAAFNTPMAAVIFTLEEIVGDLNAKILGSVIISAVIASFISTSLMGDHSTFQISLETFSHPQQYVTYFFIGLSAAVLGPLWSHSVLKMKNYFQNLLHGHQLTMIMICFFLVMIMGAFFPAVLGGGHKVLSNLLNTQYLELKWMVVLLVLKLLATSFSYGSGLSGGLFMPTLFIGASLGGTVGLIFKSIDPEWAGAIGSYALIGMGAYFASVIRSPVTSILIIFEMTHNYDVILPLMVANMTSYLLSSRFDSRSIYESLAEAKGIHLPTREDDELLDSLHVEDAMVKDVYSLYSHQTLEEAQKVASTWGRTGFPVLDQLDRLVGVMTTSRINVNMAQQGEETLVGQVCTKKIISVYPDQSLLVALHKLRSTEIGRLIVISRLDNKKLVGIITAEDIVSKFGYHVQKESKQSS